MAYLVKNVAVLNYNDDQTSNCEVTVLVDDLPEAYKRAYTNSDGVIFESGMVDDKLINYEIEVINYSTKQKNNMVVKDSFQLPAPYENSFSVISSNYPYEIQTDGILFNIGTLSAGERLLIIYTVQLGEDVPSAVDIHNSAKVEYEDKPQEAAIETGDLVVTTTDPVIPPQPDPPQPEPSQPAVPITITGTKTAPGQVLCGESFSYVLSFPNTNDDLVEVTSIADVLPEQFVMTQVQVQANGLQKTVGQDYTVILDGQTLNIEAINGRLDIEPEQELLLTITGYSQCLN